MHHNKHTIHSFAGLLQDCTADLNEAATLLARGMSMRHRWIAKEHEPLYFFYRHAENAVLGIMNEAATLLARRRKRKLLNAD